MGADLKAVAVVVAVDAAATTVVVVVLDTADESFVTEAVVGAVVKLAVEDEPVVAEEFGEVVAAVVAAVDIASLRPVVNVIKLFFSIFKTATK
jgi:hypothetical protein